MLPDDKRRQFFVLRTGAPLGLASLLCVGILLVASGLGLAAPAGLWLKYDYLTAPLLLAAVSFALSLPSESRISPGIRTVFMLCVSFLVLMGVWQAGVSDWHMVGGLLPYSDAGGYYSDALRLIHGHKFSVFSSRRPLFPAFFAALLNLTNLNLRVALVLLTGMTVLAIGLAVREVQRSLGVGAGILMLLNLFMFYRRFIGATLTEHLGLTFGCLAFALLWRGAGGDRPGPVLFGLFLLSLGLNARAGAFLILPALVLWAAWACRGPSGSALWALGRGIAAIALAFGVNGILLYALGIPDAAHSNFSYTLYGLVFGGNWSLALQQHPELASLAPLEQTSRVYSLAWEQIQVHPMTLLSGTVRAWTAFFWGRSGTWFSHILYRGPDPADLRQMLLAEGVSALNFRRDPWILLDGVARQLWGIGLIALLIAGVVVLRRNYRRPLARLLIAAWAGMLLSVPFVPPWDADNMRAYAATLPFVIALPVMGLSYRRQGQEKWGAGDEGGASSRFTGVWAFSAILLALLVLGSLTGVTGGLARIAHGQEQHCAPGCKEAGHTRLVLLDPRAAIHLVDSREELEANRAGSSLSVRDLRERKHLKDYPDVWHMWRGLSRLPSSTTLAMAYDIHRGDSVYVQSASSAFPGSRGVVALCGEVIRHGWVEWFRVDSLAAC